MISKLIVSFVNKNLKYKDSVYQQSDASTHIYIVIDGGFEIVKIIKDDSHRIVNESN